MCSIGSPFQSSDYLFMKFAVQEFPDRFSIDGGQNYINATLGSIDPVSARNGDWEWDPVNNEFKYIGE